MLLFPYPYNKPAFIIGSEKSWYESSGLSVFGREQEELPNVMTPMTADEVAKALAAAFKRLTGKLPSVKILSLLLGQWALESANGKAIHNFNYTNIKRNSGDPFYQYFRCSEIVDGVEQFFDPPSPVCAFAAYKSATDGAEAYIRILKKRPNWWNGLLTGDIEQFNAGLSTAPKFYTANPTLYLNVLSDRVAHYLPQAQKYGATLGSAIVSAVVGIGLGVAVLRFGPPLYRQYSPELISKLHRLKARI
jgi:hypothetical protein